MAGRLEVRVEFDDKVSNYAGCPAKWRNCISRAKIGLTVRSVSVHCQKPQKAHLLVPPDSKGPFQLPLLGEMKISSGGEIAVLAAQTAANAFRRKYEH